MKSASNSRAWVQFWQSNKPTTQTRVIQPLHAPFPRGLFLDSCRVLSHNSDLMDAKLIGFFNDVILYFGAPSAEEISSMGVCVCLFYFWGFEVSLLQNPVFFCHGLNPTPLLSQGSLLYLTAAQSNPSHSVTVNDRVISVNGSQLG